MITALLSGYVTCASLSRSAVVAEQQPRSQLSIFISGIVLLLILLFIAPLFEHLPMCVLASIVIVALKGVLNRMCGNVAQACSYNSTNYRICIA